MLEKIKHSKIKNTGIIYQVLIKRVVEQALDGQFAQAHKIFNKFFNKGSELSKELSLYNALNSKRYINQITAKTLLQQSINQRMRLDDNRLQRQKYLVIKQIKKHYDLKQLFSANIQNYKVYASIYKVFESLKKMQYNPIQIAESKSDIMQYMIRPLQQKVIDQDIEFFKRQSRSDKQRIIQVFVDKYNEKFDGLNDKQKELIKRYSYEFTTTKNIQNFINQQVDKFKQKNQDSQMQQIRKLTQSVQDIKSIKILQDKVYALLNLYELEKQLA